MKFVDFAAQYSRLESSISKRVNHVLTSGQYIMGPEIKELETALAQFVGVEHCITVANGTDALMLALMALQIQPGDEIITTPFSFFATAEVISFLGAVPVFADINPHTYNIDPDQIETLITDKTKVIMPVSLYGQCADFTRINAIAEKHGLAVIEDAAQSFGATHHGRRSCGLSTIGCTSFFPTKPLGCYGDGGACFTNDATLAETLRMIRVHGQQKRYYHTKLGVNSRLDTLQAAILLAKFEVFEDEINQRQLIAKRYDHLLNEQFVVPAIESFNTSVYAQYTIQVENRAEIQKKLEEAGIPTAVHYPTLLNHQPAISKLPHRAGQLPNAERLVKKVLCLPMHPYLAADEQNRVAQALLEAAVVYA